MNTVTESKRIAVFIPSVSTPPMIPAEPVVAKANSNKKPPIPFLAVAPPQIVFSVGILPNPSFI